METRAEWTSLSILKLQKQKQKTKKKQLNFDKEILWNLGILQLNFDIEILWNLGTLPEPCNFIKKETQAQEFSWKFSEISKTTFFTEHFWWMLLNSQ